MITHILTTNRLFSKARAFHGIYNKSGVSAWLVPPRTFSCSTMTLRVVSATRKSTSKSSRLFHLFSSNTFAFRSGRFSAVIPAPPTGNLSPGPAACSRRPMLATQLSPRSTARCSTRSLLVPRPMQERVFLPRGRVQRYRPYPTAPLKQCSTCSSMTICMPATGQQCVK